MSDRSDATLVLLHPVGLRGSAFFGLGLAGAVAPDLLGHGGRPRQVGMTLADVADDVAAQIPGRLDVAGFSFGGMVAIELALRHPDRVRSLVVACAPAAVNPSVILPRAAAAEELGMQGVLASTLERWFTNAALDAPAHPGVEFASRTLLALDPDVFADGWRAIATHDAVARLPGLSIPVTCIAGDADVSAPPEQVRAIAELVPGARFVVVEGPHMAFLEQPGAIAGAIEEHLARLG